MKIEKNVINKLKAIFGNCAEKRRFFHQNSKRQMYFKINLVQVDCHAIVNRIFVAIAQKTYLMI
jgi:hypothetical protein